MLGVVDDLDVDGQVLPQRVDEGGDGPVARARHRHVLALDHELGRHRAGFSYSQLSQRYVDESVAEYVEPDVIANDPELHSLWLESVRQSHDGPSGPSYEREVFNER